MSVFRCNTYPELSVYLPENQRTVKFRRGRLDTADLDDELRLVAERRLRSTTECYEDDGTLECPYQDCQKPFASQLGLDRHLRDLHGGMTPQQLAESRVGVSVSVPLPVADDGAGDEEPAQAVRAARGTRRAVAE